MYDDPIKYSFNSILYFDITYISDIECIPKVKNSIAVIAFFPDSSLYSFSKNIIPISTKIPENMCVTFSNVSMLNELCAIFIIKKYITQNIANDKFIAIFLIDSLSIFIFLLSFIF